MRDKKESKPFPSNFLTKIDSLKIDKGRMTHSLFLVENENHILDITKSSPEVIKEVFVTEKYSSENPSKIKALKEKSLGITVLSEKERVYISSVETPQGIACTCHLSNLKINWSTCKKITLLDEIQDPGNLGSIFRTSVAMGYQGIILGKGTCDLYNPKVVRSSVSSFLKMPFEINVDLKQKISFLRSKGFRIITTSPRAKVSLNSLTTKKKIALIVGNEGRGVNPALASMADLDLSIPLQNQTESLNVVVAHGIISYHLQN